MIYGSIYSLGFNLTPKGQELLYGVCEVIEPEEKYSVQLVPHEDIEGEMEEKVMLSQNISIKHPDIFTALQTYYARHLYGLATAYIQGDDLTSDEREFLIHEVDLSIQNLLEESLPSVYPTLAALVARYQMPLANGASLRL